MSTEYIAAYWHETSPTGVVLECKNVRYPKYAYMLLIMQNGW